MNKIALSILKLAILPVRLGRIREEKGSATVPAAARPAAQGMAASGEDN